MTTKIEPNVHTILNIADQEVRVKITTLLHDIYIYIYIQAENIHYQINYTPTQ